MVKGLSPGLGFVWVRLKRADLADCPVWTARDQTGHDIAAMLVRINGTFGTSQPPKPPLSFAGCHVVEMFRTYFLGFHLVRVGFPTPPTLSTGKGLSGHRKHLILIHSGN